MTSSSSHSPVFTRLLTDQDDSMPSPYHIQQQQYQSQRSRIISHSSNDDDDDDDDVVETFDAQPVASDFFEINDALMGVFKSHIEFMASTHRHINRNKKKKKNSQTHFSTDNNDHHSQQGLIVDSQSHYQRTRTTSDVQQSPTTSSPERIPDELYDELNIIIANTKLPRSVMEKLVQQNPLVTPQSQSSRTSVLGRLVQQNPLMSSPTSTMETPVQQDPHLYPPTSTIRKPFQPDPFFSPPTSTARKPFQPDPLFSPLASTIRKPFQSDSFLSSPSPTMEKLIQQYPIFSPHSQSSPSSLPSGTGVLNLISTPSPPSPSRPAASPRSSETNEVIVYPTSVSLRGLLSYQDVMSAVEREFHLHEGQEREIIMRLWLKGQTMLSILQRYRHLLEDLNLDDQDFLGGMKHIREMINYADRDVHYLREQTVLLENQNRFLESEFQRQLDKIVTEKNEQISRLIHIIDQTCPPPTEYTDHVNDLTHSSGNPDLLSQKFMQQNVELQRELETLRAKLEFTFTLINEKLDQQTGASIVQTAIEQMRQSDAKLQEIQLKSSVHQEENDILRYLLDKSQRSSNTDVTQLFSVIEQRSLEREISRVRHELEITEKKITELEHRFEHSDENVKFNIERLKLKCDVLRQHIGVCNQRLDEAVKQTPVEFIDDMQITKHERRHHDEGRNAIQLENELLQLRERYNDLAEYSTTIQFELENARKQIHERSLLERDTFDSSVVGNDSIDLEQERRRSAQLENELISLKLKYEDVCERVTAATLQLERVQVVLEQTLRRCEQLEKEKSEINAQSEYLSQNVASVTAKYKDRMNIIKSRLEQTDRERRDAQSRTEQLQNEIERLKNELTHKKEMIFEKDKLIQDAQYKSREILLERQSVEDRISNEYKRLNELVDKNRFLEEELERMRRSQILENITVRRTDVINLDSATIDSSNRLEELKSKINDFERRFTAEKYSKESLQVQIKILEEENADLRDIMSQMRKRTHDDRREDRDRNDEIQQLIARAETNARHYMSNFNLATSPTSSLVRIIPLSSPTRIS